MGKKSKQKTPAPSSRAASMINTILVVGVALLVTGGIVWYSVREPAVDTRPPLPKPDVTTLAPESFTGRTKLAYAAAREVPGLLAQLPCYCGCMSGSGHRSNLDCFHDLHGVECAMCQNIALDARDLYNDGYDVERIRQYVKDKYGRSAALTP